MQIREAALAVFSERGYDAGSIAEIAQRAHVAKSVLYHHHGDKAGLYEHVLEAANEGLIGRVEAAINELPQGTHHRERQVTAVDAYLAFVQDRPHEWVLLVRDPPADAAARALNERCVKRRTRAMTAIFRPPTARRNTELAGELFAISLRAYVSWWARDRRIGRRQMAEALVAAGDGAARSIAAANSRR